MEIKFSLYVEIDIVHLYLKVGLPVPRTSAPSAVGEPECTKQHKQQGHAQKQLKRDMKNEFHGSGHLKKLPYFYQPINFEKIYFSIDQIKNTI